MACGGRRRRGGKAVCCDLSGVLWCFRLAVASRRGGDLFVGFAGMRGWCGDGVSPVAFGRQWWKKVRVLAGDGKWRAERIWRLWLFSLFRSKNVRSGGGLEMRLRR
ncbi:hypothetical protein HAX54_038629 [Datura stramonium]|uniref:Uncharacterized protein n=1 Tax=Datura stramonium TaxID=4076 RepID=A0ABS8SI60_DATST|nr:hypothetical protein [Datura stramonium]